MSRFFEKSVPRATFAFFLFLIFSFSSNGLLFAGKIGKSRSENFESEKLIAQTAQAIAQQRLSKNPKDKIGNILTKLANHLYPEYLPLLLLRGKIKYRLKVLPPAKTPPPESKFVHALKIRMAELSKKNNMRDRHLAIVYASIIRFFEPEDEKSIIFLMQAQDQGEQMNLDKLLVKKFSAMPFNELDPKDPRYSIGKVTKTVEVPAKEPWTETWIKVKAGQIIHFESRRFWSLGGGGAFPYTDADGYSPDSMREMVDRGNTGKRDRSRKTRWRPPKFITKKIKGTRDLRPGCLLAKIGRKIYPLGKSVTIKAENSGVLMLGPFEWDVYSDNSGYLLVTISVSDK
ncbi:MAG: hypothetical protein GXP32_03820 [Kiritimatiellaeota bacterium]|nr:hypothetical protein [Kiritimatiellota bacterium]